MINKLTLERISQENKKILDAIIKQLRKGAPPWRMPWVRNADLNAGYIIVGAKKFSANLWPRNIRTPEVSFNAYNGIRLIVAAMINEYATNFWVNQKTVDDLNLKILKGEAPWLIQRHYSYNHVVYNIEQFANYERALGLTHIRNGAADEHFSCREAEDLFHKLRREASPPLVVEMGQDEAAYYPTKDCIHMPSLAQFIDKDEMRGEANYWATMWHEVTHWTGHQERLGRFNEIDRFFVGRRYGFEELVAELGAVFLCSKLNIDANIQGASYIDGWLKGVIGNDLSGSDRNRLIENWADLLEIKGIGVLEAAGQYADKATVFISNGGKEPPKKKTSSPLERLFSSAR